MANKRKKMIYHASEIFTRSPLIFLSPIKCIELKWVNFQNISSIIMNTIPLHITHTYISIMIYLYYLQRQNTTEYTIQSVHRSDATTRNARAFYVYKAGIMIISLTQLRVLPVRAIIQCLCFTQFQRRRIIMSIVGHSDSTT